MIFTIIDNLLLPLTSPDVISMRPVNILMVVVLPNLLEMNILLKFLTFLNNNSPAPL
jgi:hypothetical protein